jgi:AraC family transcriptional regulator of adaptative response / DNA-3-methyladenine glycosylase II
MEAGGLSDNTIAGLADSLGITDRHLRRVFSGEYGVPPIAWLQTRRLLSAKQLLTETNLPVMQVAMDAGFGSVRRLNALFRTHYRLSPARFRKATRAPYDPAAPLTLSLAYRPPMAWAVLLRFLGSRAIPGVEYVTDSQYRRVVSIEKDGRRHEGWISVSNCAERNALEVTLSADLFPVVNQVLARVRFMFDLNCTPDEIGESLMGMSIGGRHIFVPGLRLPGCFDPFEMAVRAVLGQRITVRGARTLAARVASRLGRSIETPFGELSVVFPSQERIWELPHPIEDRLGPLGITGAQARSIYSLAEALEQGTLRLGPGADPEREMRNMARLPGFGPWTVQYLAMRALGWPDAFPHTDYGVKKALGNMEPGQMQAFAQKWSPWRSYATLCLWNYLDRENGNTMEDASSYSISM